jgi:hypothetical protein
LNGERIAERGEGRKGVKKGVENGEEKEKKGGK